MIRRLRPALFSLNLLTALVSALGLSAQAAQNPVRLDVHLREAPKLVFHANLTLPVPPGPLTLVYPKWIPGSPVPTAGFTPAMRLVAVNGRKCSPKIFRDAIRRANNSGAPIDRFAENGDSFRTYRIACHRGERYPHLEAIGAKPDVLSEIIRMRAAAVPVTATG